MGELSLSAMAYRGVFWPDKGKLPQDCQLSALLIPPASHALPTGRLFRPKQVRTLVQRRASRRHSMDFYWAVSTFPVCCQLHVYVTQYCSELLLLFLMDVHFLWDSILGNRILRFYATNE